MKLIFVYNADSGALNGLFDIAHKLFQPDTYQCALCSLTHDTFAEKQIWKDFRERNHAQMSFYHKDEFEQTFHTKFTYPVVLSENGNTLDTVMSAEDLAKTKNADALIERIESVLAPK